MDFIAKPAASSNNKVGQPDALTHERLRELLEYDPTTGIMRWRTDSGIKKTAGKIAGVRNLGGYWIIGIGAQRYYRSRLAWFYVYGRWPSHQIDHINRQRDDDRLANLREATRAQNAANRKGWGRSGYKGASYVCRDRRFQATINANGSNVNLGTFATAAQAGAAYERAAATVHGEFAYQYEFNSLGTRH